MTTEYRALEMFSSLPAGCIAHPATDEDCEPHVKLGEFAVVDKNDRDPTFGELYLIEWNNGTREIVQVSRSFAEGKLSVGPYAQEYTEGVGSYRMVDGPYTVAHLRQKLIGRVIGILSPPSAT